MNKIFTKSGATSYKLQATGSQGFTLIELLVVVAIIGILSSVVLASLNTARNKGTDAAIRANMASIRPQAEIAYDAHNSYDLNGTGFATTTCDDNLFAESTIKGMLQAAAKAAGGDITSWPVGTTIQACEYQPADSSVIPPTPEQWAVTTILKTGDFWCVDSQGHAQISTSADLPSAVSGGTCN